MMHFWPHLVRTLDLQGQTKALAEVSVLTGWRDECGADRFDLFCPVPELVSHDRVTELGVAMFVKSGRPALINVVSGEKND